MHPQLQRGLHEGLERTPTLPAAVKERLELREDALRRGGARLKKGEEPS